MLVAVTDVFWNIVIFLNTCTSSVCICMHLFQLSSSASTHLCDVILTVFVFACCIGARMLRESERNKKTEREREVGGERERTDCHREALALHCDAGSRLIMAVDVLNGREEEQCIALHLRTSLTHRFAGPLCLAESGKRSAGMKQKAGARASCRMGTTKGRSSLSPLYLFHCLSLSLVISQVMHSV